MAYSSHIMGYSSNIFDAKEAAGSLEEESIGPPACLMNDGGAMPRTRQALKGTKCYIPGPQLHEVIAGFLPRAGLGEFEISPCRKARLHVVSCSWPWGCVRR